jgi:hypothetical protein
VRGTNAHSGPLRTVDVLEWIDERSVGMSLERELARARQEVQEHRSEGERRRQEAEQHSLAARSKLPELEEACHVLANLCREKRIMPFPAESPDPTPVPPPFVKRVPLPAHFRVANRGDTSWRIAVGTDGVLLEPTCVADRIEMGMWSQSSWDNDWIVHADQWMDDLIGSIAKRIAEIE